MNPDMGQRILVELCGEGKSITTSQQHHPQCILSVLLINHITFLINSLIIRSIIQDINKITVGSHNYSF